MTTKPVSPPRSTAATTTRPRLTPLPDPPRLPDMATQLPYIARAHIVLDDWFRDRPDVLVSGEGYLCYEAGDARRSPHPDCLVALGLTIPTEEIELANGYTISEIGKPPDFVLEVASESTGVRDYTVKRELYAGLKVAEYWRFDRTGGRFHDAALAGDRLTTDGRYERISVTEQADGIIRGYSAVLGLELRWVAGWLHFWDPVTEEYLPDLTEAKAQRNDAITQRNDAIVRREAEASARRQAEAQRDNVIAQRDAAVNRAQEEAAARRQAEERVRQLEAELRRRQAEN